MKTIKVLYTILFVACLLMAGLLCLSADTWLKIIDATINPSAEQLQKIADLFFPDNKISLYRMLSGIPLLAAVLLFWKRNVFTDNLHKYSSSLRSYLKHLWQVQIEILRKRKKIELVLNIIAISGLVYYFAGKFPFTVDEAFSWVHLVNKGPLVSAFYYPAPNNHIFYTVICSFVNYLPLDPVWVMRIPTVAAYMLCNYILYLMLARLLDKRASEYTLFLFAIHSSVIYYALHGRGYMFLILFVILSCWFLYSALQNKVKPAYAAFVICCVLGFYTIPVFLYYFILLLLTAAIYVLWNKAYDRIKILIISFTAVIVFTSLLYLPVLMLNGADALLNNSWVQPQAYTHAQIYAYIIEVLVNLSGFEGIWLLIPFVFGTAFLIFFYYERKSSRWVIIAMLLWAPVLIAVLAVQKVLPFDRIWVPFVALWVIIIVWIEAWLEEIGKVQWIGAAMLSFMIYNSAVNLKENFGKEDPYYGQLHAFVKMVDPSKISSVYSADDTYLVMLQVKFARAGKEASFTSVPDLHGQNADLRIIPLSSVDKEVISADEERFYYNSYMVAYRRKDLQILR